MNLVFVSNSPTKRIRKREKHVNLQLENFQPLYIFFHSEQNYSEHFRDLLFFRVREKHGNYYRNIYKKLYLTLDIFCKHWPNWVNFVTTISHLTLTISCSFNFYIYYFKHKEPRWANWMITFAFTKKVMYEHKNIKLDSKTFP